jgi:hypothetical protein
MTGIGFYPGLGNRPPVASASAATNKQHQDPSIEKYARELAAELCAGTVLVNALDSGWLQTDLGGATVDHAVKTVLPGALVPDLLENKDANGSRFAPRNTERPDLLKLPRRRNRRAIRSRHLLQPESIARCGPELPA